MKQIRYGTDNSKGGAARVGSITQQHINEIAARTGESQNEVVRRACAVLWMIEVYGEQARKIEELQQALEKCEAALVEAANQ